MRRVLIGLVAISVFGLTAVATAPQAFAKTHSAKVVHAKKVKVVAHDPVIYDSIIDPNPGNVPSLGFEATQGYEVGNQVTFAGNSRVLNDVIVQLSSWGCQSGSWGGPQASPPTAACETTPGATFNEPITVDIYAVGNGVTPGALLASETQTFAIPYRPSADPNYATDCLPQATAESEPVSDFDGTWYDTNVNPPACFNGDFTQVDVTFGHVTLPNSVIYGIEYPTSDYGFPAYGDNTACHSSAGGCGYDSLNVALSEEPPSPSVGSDLDNGTIYWDTTYAGFYCDGGTDGVGVFRNDSPEPGDQCWEPGANDTPPYYIPAVQFNAVNTPSPTFTSGNTATAVAGQSFSFPITTDGVPAPTVTRIAGKLPKGLLLTRSSGGTATIYGTPLTKDHNGVYRFVIKAKGARNSVAKQIFSLTLTGGKA